MQYPVFIRLRILKLSQILYDDAFLPVKIRNPSLNQGKGERLKIFFLRQYAVGKMCIRDSYKVSPERGEKDGSSGLGLYIVKTTAESMGGSVWVESTLGKGTVFTVTFSAR